MNTTDAMFGASPKRFQMPLCDKVINTEISNDYTLPDYLPAIRRVLRVSAAPLPPAKYIGGGRAEFNGTVDYKLIYIGSDGELYSAPLSAEYTMSTPLDISSDFDLNEGIILLCDLSDENITVRVSAPRKLNIKCRLCARVRALGIMVAEERVSGDANPLSIERLMGEVSSTVTFAGLGETIELSEEFPMSDDNARVVSADADIIIGDLTPSEGYAECHGEAIISITVCREGESGSCEVMNRGISFSAQVEIDGLSPEAKCRGKAYISDMNVNVEEGKILCSLGIIPEVIAYCEESNSYTRDLYSTENFCETAQRSYSLPSVTPLPAGNFSQSERIALSETSMQAGSRIIDVICRPLSERFVFESGRLSLMGQCRYSMILESEGEYSVCELSVPFKYDSPERLDPSLAVSDVSSAMQSLACRARIDGDNLCIDTELSVSADVISNTPLNCLSEVRFGEPIARSDGDMIICFPAPDDTPWSVAKKYFVPVSNLSISEKYIIVG